MTFVIMAFALYVPALKGKSKADALSGQTVVFAFMFVAVRMALPPPGVKKRGHVTARRQTEGLESRATTVIAARPCHRAATTGSTPD